MKPAVLKKAFSPKVLAKIALLLFILRLGIIPIQIGIIHHQTPNPQAIFVLGGGRDREKAAAKLAQAYPQLPIALPSQRAQSTNLEIGCELTDCFEPAKPLTLPLVKNLVTPLNQASHCAIGLRPCFANTL